MQSPCFVLGDIHGNLRDLRRYERSLWPRAPVCVTGQYLFLGDYVDRGEYGVECVLYLFALKVVAPDRFSLLRGNHEVAAIQRQYTFSRECETKFGQFGRPIWKAINRCFDSMPLAAVVDDRIFCAHGGIPRTIQDLEELNRSIPTPLENPEHQSPASWEILWNDPITDAELIGMIDMERLNPSILSTTLNVTTRDFPQTTNQNGTTQELPLAPATPVPIINDGFIGNVKRGTAYFYSDQAVYHFLRLNRLTHIIRAHEVVPHGYAFHCDAKVITIFSSSRYCGLNNQAACVLVDRDKLRIMRLDTSNDSVTSSRSDFSL
ncbi:Serine/threonine-protein phosphatase PP1, partial [Fragariocoptes setiger]